MKKSCGPTKMSTSDAAYLAVLASQTPPRRRIQTGEPHRLQASQVASQTNEIPLNPPSRFDYPARSDILVIYCDQFNKFHGDLGTNG